MTSMTIKRQLRFRLGLTGAALLASSLLGCAERDEIWDAPANGATQVLGLRNAAAVIDAPANRVLMLPVTSDNELAPVSISIGEGFVAAESTLDGEQLLIMSAGVQPRRSAEDAGPSISLLKAGSGSPSLVHRYGLSDPLSNLALDPRSKYAVAYAGSTTSFVSNPNELVVVDITEAPSATNPTSLSIRSFGGRPQALTFTGELGLPGGPSRLLVVQTDRDIALVDLNALDQPEVTVQLSANGAPMVPGGVAISDGDAERTDDTRIAVRVQGDANVVIVDLLPVPEDQKESTPQSYRASPNVVYVGGTPSDIDFVQTDGGLRLAALVPGKQLLTLVDPATGIASEVPLGGSFERLRLVTDIVGEATDGSDVALVWSTNWSQVGFVALGSTVGKPYKSVELLALTEPVSEVIDVPPPNDHLKILRSAGGGSLVVLDLLARTASPLNSAGGANLITVAPDGTRAWIAGGSANLAQLDLESLHPRNVTLSRPASFLVEVDRAGGGRALIALDSNDTLGATVLDANNPNLADAREYLGLLLGGLK